MRSVKLLTDSLGPERAAADRWYVSNGVTAVGPVNTDLLARGIEAGKVPLESFIRHEAWKVWRPLSEVAIVTGTDGGAVELWGSGEAGGSRPDAITIEEQASFEALSRPVAPSAPRTETPPSWPSGESDATDVQVWARPQSFQDSGGSPTPPGLPPFRQNAGPVSEPDFAIFTPPPPPPDPADADTLNDNGPLPAPPLLAVPVIEPVIEPVITPLPTSAPRPVNAPASDARPTPRLDQPISRAAGLGTARNLSEALLLLLSAATERTSSEAAVVHHVLNEGAMVVCSHGPRMHEILGRRTPLTDPALMAAASGLSIVTEPAPGPAGQAILGRLSELGAPVSFALMLPIRPGGRLFGMLEMGRPTPFSPGEVAQVGDLTAEVARLINAAGWA
jgi:hypothetical protein